MKKKALFVLQSIVFGGSMTSLINLATLLNKEQVKEIELEMLFMVHDGDLLQQAQKAGTVLKRDWVLEAVTKSRKNMHGLSGLLMLIIRFWCLSLGKLYGITAQEQSYKIAAQKYSNKYDCIISYQESVATDFVCYIEAPKKYAWIHNDLDNISKIYPGNKLPEVYSQYDKIVCVSDAAKKHFIENSGIKGVEKKITRIYNTFNTSSIIEKSAEPATEMENAPDVPKLITVGRATEQKRFDRVLDAAALLRKDGFKFAWFVIGDGTLLPKMKKRCHDDQLEDCVHFIGSRSNPFAYVSKADIMVITSFFEAHPMVANESLIVHTPVISTNYSSAKEVITNGVTGLICENSSEGVYSAVREIFSSPKKLKQLKENVKDFEYDNEGIKNQVKDLILGNCNI